MFDVDDPPRYSSFCRWENEYRTRERHRLLRRSAEQAGWSGEAAIDASGFQRDQTSYHDRVRANHSWSDRPEERRSESTRPVIKYREQTPLQNAIDARMNEDYNQRWMSETGFSQSKKDDGGTLRSRSWHGQFREHTRKYIIHNLTQAAN